jgi:aspartyl-tRNA synthetase
MNYEIVMGLEVHVELSTKTKIFCGCSTEFGGEPNAHTCPVCLGMPGSLPVLNRAVVERAIRAGIALNCEIQGNNLFDRKNYFYPDLPKDYQISQLYKPICRNGWVDLDMGDYTKRVEIHEIHMEEDAGKLVHDAAGSLVDYNRCGVPLIEIVSEPDLRTADEVAAYLDKLREILVYIDVSDCKMQEGSMRADVNLSVRPAGAEAYGTRTETKNMNSIKAIRRAIAYESRRQIDIIEAGGGIHQETRRWDDEKGENYAMRSKENAQDYRYFPDPDLVPIQITDEWIEEVRSVLPEMAEEKRKRYINEFGIDKKLAGVLTGTKCLAALFEEIAEASGLPAEAANTVAGDVLRLAKENGDDIEKLSIDGKKLGVIIGLVRDGKINRNVARAVIDEVYRKDIDPEIYIQNEGLLIVSDSGLIEDIVDQVIEENAQSIADFKAGKEKAFGFLVGQAMRLLKGKADPQAVNRILRAKLEVARAAGSGGTGAEVGAAIGGGTGAAALAGGSGTTAAAAGSGGTGAEVGEAIGSGTGAAVETAGMLDGTRAPTDAPAQTAVIAGRTAALTQGGKDLPPLELKSSGRYRTKTCGELGTDDVGTEAAIAGWIHTVRNHGGIAFIDIRDHYGTTQVVVSDEQLRGLNKENVVSIRGHVLLRDEETVNPNIATGLVELKAENIEILGKSKANLPFEIDMSTDTREDLRLKYRFLDLRNHKVHDNIILRAAIIRHLRNAMESMGFLEIQTPILANSSPEGARDYLVPSRKFKGMFYALPQAPQQFKQLLMVSGFDKYYQIAPCFRDEDARLDRSPGEFYQLDFEMAFATQEDVFEVAEQALISVFHEFTDKPVSKPPFVRIPFAEAMLKYGTDKPDLRNPLIVQDLSHFFAKVDFAPFKGRTVRGIVVPDAGKQPRSFFASMEKYALAIGMKGLGYISVKDDLSYKGPIDKFFTDEQRNEIAGIAALKPQDVLYFICDEEITASKFAGQIRTEAAARLGLIDKNKFEFCFITDFPMYEINEESGKVDFTHNPFSMPQGEMEALLSKDPLEIKAWQYDIVCNGVELSSGAVRNHRPDVMVKAFEIAGYSEDDVRQKFGALYNAFQYGAPPHAGMAPGVDRIVMLIAGEENIREVIAFPLNSNAQNLMLGAPGEVTETQLREVHIKIR